MGKSIFASLREALRGRRDVHASKPRVVSLTNTTELGTLYRPDEIGRTGGVRQEQRSGRSRRWSPFRKCCRLGWRVRRRN